MKIIALSRSISPSEKNHKKKYWTLAQKLSTKQDINVLWISGTNRNWTERKIINNNNEHYLKIAIEDLRKLFWKEVGVNRSQKGMQIALNSISLDFDNLSKHPLLNLISNQKPDICNSFNETNRKKINLVLDLNHRQLTSLLTLNACLFRSESRGGHYRLDSPIPLPYWTCHSSQVKGKTISTRPVR